MIAIAGSGSSNECRGLSAITKGSFSFCQQFEGLVEGDSGFGHANHRHYVVIVRGETFDELLNEVAVCEAPIRNMCQLILVGL